MSGTKSASLLRGALPAGAGKLEAGAWRGLDTQVAALKSPRDNRPSSLRSNRLLRRPIERVDQWPDRGPQDAQTSRQRASSWPSHVCWRPGELELDRLSTWGCGDPGHQGKSQSDHGYVPRDVFERYRRALNTCSSSEIATCRRCKVASFWGTPGPRLTRVRRP